MSIARSSPELGHTSVCVDTHLPLLRTKDDTRTLRLLEACNMLYMPIAGQGAAQEWVVCRMAPTDAMREVWEETRRMRGCLPPFERYVLRSLGTRRLVGEGKLIAAHSFSVVGCRPEVVGAVFFDISLKAGCIQTLNTD